MQQSKTEKRIKHKQGVKFFIRFQEHLVFKVHQSDYKMCYKGKIQLWWGHLILLTSAESLFLGKLGPLITALLISLKIYLLEDYWSRSPLFFSSKKPTCPHARQWEATSADFSPWALAEVLVQELEGRTKYPAQGQCSFGSWGGRGDMARVCTWFAVG